MNTNLGEVVIIPANDLKTITAEDLMFFFGAFNCYLNP